MVKRGFILICLDKDGHGEGPYCEKGAEIKIFDTVEDAEAFIDARPDEKYRKMTVQIR